MTFLYNVPRDDRFVPRDDRFAPRDDRAESRMRRDM